MTMTRPFFMSAAEIHRSQRYFTVSELLHLITEQIKLGSD